MQVYYVQTMDVTQNNSFMKDPECRKCALLPICNGGCPNERIENLFEGAKHSLCALYHADNGEVLYDVLYDYYLNRNKRQTV